MEKKEKGGKKKTKKGGSEKRKMSYSLKWNMLQCTRKMEQSILVLCLH